MVRSPSGFFSVRTVLLASALSCHPSGTANRTGGSSSVTEAPPAAGGRVACPAVEAGYSRARGAQPASSRRHSPSASAILFTANPSCTKRADGPNPYTVRPLKNALVT